MYRLTISLFLLPIWAWANIPAEYVACEGAQDGDPCRLPGPRHGNCILDTLCVDGEAIPQNECLICRDYCGVLEPGEVCLRRDGTHGVCVRQPADRPCTDKPETSFDECVRCEAGEPEATEPEEGCQAADAMVAAPWALIGLAGLLQLGRRRRDAR